jgi:hypothetical protein
VDTLSIRTLSPEVPADERPHGCYEGFVYIGYMQYEDEHGDEVEVFEAVPCRRCAYGNEDLPS